MKKVNKQMMEKREKKIELDRAGIILFIGLLFILILIMLLCVSTLNALGVTPGRTTINYEKSLEREVMFSVLNSENKDLQIMLIVQGELKDSVVLYDSLVEFKENEASKQFKYKIKLPDSIATSPGLHSADIVILEIPKAGAGGTFVGASVAVVSQVFIYVSYPGKYLDADLNILDSEENNTATFIVPIINRGKVGIGDARALIDIYDTLNRKVASVETDYAGLEPGKRSELSGKWRVNVSSGDYIGKVTLLYDGETRNIEKQFAIGIQSLGIESILVNNFKLGQVAKLQILVENRWSKELKNVFANLLVYDTDYQVMADVKSASEDILPLTKKELIAYWDTVGVKEGEYDGKLMVKYDEKSSDKNLILKVKENSLDVVGVGYAINPRGRKGVSLTTILIIVIILLIIVNISWFVFFMIIKKKRLK